MFLIVFYSVPMVFMMFNELYLNLNQMLYRFNCGASAAIYYCDLHDIIR